MSDPLEDEIRRQKYVEMLMTPSVRKTEQEEVAESPLPTEAKYINKVSTKVNHASNYPHDLIRTDG